MKKLTTIAIIILFVLFLIQSICGKSHPGSELANNNEAPEISEYAEVISFEQALEGKGEMYIIYAHWSQEKKTLLDNRIIPVIETGEGLQLLDSLKLVPKSSNGSYKWNNLSEYGYESKDSLYETDHASLFSTDKSAPNLNFALKDGSISSLNLIYIEDAEINLVEHTYISVSKVFDHETYSVNTGGVLYDWYSPDYSSMTLKSHIVLSKDGEVGLLKDKSIWGKTTDGLYLTVPNSKGQNRRYVGYSKSEGFSLACSEKEFAEDSWKSIIYSSPLGLRSVILSDKDAIDFNVNKSIWFGNALFSGGAPIPTNEPYTYQVNTQYKSQSLSELHHPTSKLKQYDHIKEISTEAKALMGLDSSKDDSDNDGIPDGIEIAMNSDPLDAHTEGKRFNDFEMYFKMGMFPPIQRKDTIPLVSPEPKSYKGVTTPSSPMKTPITRRPGTPIQFKVERLLEEGKQSQASEVKHRAVKMFVYKHYGEEALTRFAEREDTPVLMRFVEEWPEYYGEEDPDEDGIPTDMENLGHLFGGLNYSDFGSHYWDRLTFIADHYSVGYDGSPPSLWEYLREDSATGDRFIETNPESFDTDGDGLDDYFEYLWHSCPLLQHSDNSSGAKNDHDKIYQNFTAPRSDWIADFQDHDNDGIPNGAEIYFQANVCGWQGDPYAASTDWDQYNDRQEWMSWWYKKDYPYPLDDPLPYVIRNGPHPLIPAYPQIKIVHVKDKLLLPFHSTFTSARGISGSSSLTAQITNVGEIGTAFKFGFIPVIKASASSKERAKSTSSVTDVWDMTSTTSYDYSQAIVKNKFKIKNIGTEPLDNSPAHEFSMKINIYWPNDYNRIYAHNQEIDGVEGLIPYQHGETDLPDSLPITITNTLSDLVGIEVEIGNTDNSMPDLGDFETFKTTASLTNTGISFLLPLTPGIGFAAAKVAVSGEIIAGSMLINEYENDLYKDFIDDFQKAKSMQWVTSVPPSYNSGDDGIFSPDNPCDWTSIRAAHRNYVTLMCIYPGESDLKNLLKESPIKPESERSSPDDSFYTLREFVASYAGTKIEEFEFDTTGDMDTLLRVGCFPNVGYNDTVMPVYSYCDTLTTFGKWTITSSIDTVAEPERLDDLPENPETGDKYLGGSTELKGGDVFVLYYVHDQDSDSLEDRMEYVFGTNPNNRDTDGDGLGDKFELSKGLDPLNPNTDNSYYCADDGDEIHFLDRSEGLRVPVGLQGGDTIQPPRDSWDDYLTSSPRVNDDGHLNFVPYVYNAGGYNSETDDKYMDANTNGVPDWLEKFFHDPSDRWDGRFQITWDGPQTISHPWGYTDNVFEYSSADYHPSNKEHLCHRIRMPGDTTNGVCEIVFEDLSESSDIWDNSYAYAKLFNCDITVKKSMELSYQLAPLSENAKNICIDLMFEEGSRSIVADSFYDVNGVRMHPAWRPVEAMSVDSFHTVTAPLDLFAGKTIKAIMVGYEDQPNHQSGLVWAYLDNLCIRDKNIVLTFEDENAPPGGFSENVFLEENNILSFDKSGETPSCSLAMLPTPEPDESTSITIDTMDFGPFGNVFEFSGYLSPKNREVGDTINPIQRASILPENLDYRIQDWTTLGYYVWQEYSPIYLSNREELPVLNSPKLVVDLKIYNPGTGESHYMLEYLESVGVNLTDQWGNPMNPLERNEWDYDSNYTWRPVSGDYWRYIDIQLPDELEGWIIQDVLIYYETDLPMIGNLRTYIDNVGLFQRKDEFYVDESGSRVNFGDMLDPSYDDNSDTIVDWEEYNIHFIPEAKLYDGFTKVTYASLLRDNDIGPWGFDVDSASGDTSWHWYEYNEVLGETLYSWYATFAIDSSDTSYKLPKTWIAPEDIYTSTIDVDSFPTAMWDYSDPKNIFGYMSNIPGDSTDIYNPDILTVRRSADAGGLLEIKSLTDTMDSTLLFDVRQINPCSLCTKRCLFMVYEGWIDSGDISLGYRLNGVSKTVWFPNITSHTPMEYRHPVPNTFSSEDSSRIVESVFIKADPGAKGYIDNFLLRRAFLASFEPSDPPTFVANDLIFTENCSGDTCNIFNVDDIHPLWPTPPHRDNYLMISGQLSGFSPGRFKYEIWNFEPDQELELTGESKLSYKVFYNFDFPATYGNAILDLRLISFDETDTTWLSEYFLPDVSGETYAPHLRTDPLGHWLDIEVNLGGLPEGKMVDKMAVYFNKPSVVSGGDFKIFIDEILLTF